MTAPPRNTRQSSPPKWAARLAHVREVTLRGVADLAYWTSRLAAENLAPVPCDGQAQLLLVAADARFRGVHFRELSVSVLVRQGHDGAPAGDAACLVGAFNSNRFFAWCERTFFHTPYAHGAVRLDPTPPASIEMVVRYRTCFGVHMDTGAARPPARRSAAGFSGPIYLPRRSPQGVPRLFVAAIHGDTETHPFLPADRLTLNSLPATDGGSAADAIRSLIDSHFTPTHWELRADATHAKSKTYVRDDRA